MSEKHIIKLTATEAVVKCYVSDAGGGVVDISLENDLTANGQTFLGCSKASVAIQEVYWGAKKDKQLDISRITNPAANTSDGHYYLTNSGFYDYVGFVDNIYSNTDIRVNGDGPYHCILKLRKTGGYTGL